MPENLACFATVPLSVTYIGPYDGLIVWFWRNKFLTPFSYILMGEFEKLIPNQEALQMIKDY